MTSPWCTFDGIPTTTVPGATSLTTNALAPILQSSPTVMLPMILAPAPDEDTVANRGVTLELSAGAAAEGHLVIHEDVVTDDRRPHQ